MKKHLFRFLFFCSLMTLLLFHASAAETACDGCILGTFNGSPACVQGEKLHICTINFPERSLRNLMSMYDPSFYGDVEDGFLDHEYVDNFQDLHIREVYDNLKGIEFFINLESLNMYNCYLSKLVVANPTLKKLEITHSNVLSLDITALHNLESLICTAKALCNLDLSHNPKLTYVSGLADFEEPIALQRDPENPNVFDIGQFLGENVDPVYFIVSDSNSSKSHTYDYHTRTLTVHDLGNLTVYCNYRPKTVLETADSSSSIHFVIKCLHQFSHATCSAPATCANCGTIQGYVPHNWTVFPCTNTRKCTVCGTWRGTGSEHLWQNASCDKPLQCSVCNETKGVAKGHSFVKYESLFFPRCTVCGKYSLNVFLTFALSSLVCICYAAALSMYIRKHGKVRLY